MDHSDRSPTTFRCREILFLASRLLLIHREENPTVGSYEICKISLKPFSSKEMCHTILNLEL